MTENTYSQIPAVRRSDLWELRKSPAHYFYKITHQEEPTPSLMFGTAAHKYILEFDDFWNCYAVAPDVDRRTKAGKAAWAEFVESLGDRSPISEKDLEIIHEMDAAITANPLAAKLLRSGDHEVPIEWTDADTGELCKCRPDVITNVDGVDWIVDYKTTTSCADGAFEKACRIYGYKLQAAMYSEGVFWSQLKECRFAFVAQEKTPPYAVRVYKCDPGFVEEGEELFHDLIRILHACKTKGEWPGYEEKELIGDE